MKCPFCREPQTDTVNSRPTYHESQIWRRRRCLHCQAVFTTYERADLGFIKVIKKSGKKERYSRAKLFAGIYGAFLSIPNKERAVDAVINEIESRILDLRTKEVPSVAISKVVLNVLADTNVPAFTRFLAYNTNPKTLSELKKEIGRY